MTPSGGDDASHRRFERTRAAPDNAAHFFNAHSTFLIAHNAAGRESYFFATLLARALRCALRTAAS